MAKEEKSRSRRNDGRYRRKRSDTHIETIENEYGLDFDRRSDMHLGKLLKEKGKDSLNDLVNDE